MIECSVCGGTGFGNVCGECGGQGCLPLNPTFVDSVLQADAAPPEAVFNNAEDMLEYLNGPAPRRIIHPCDPPDAEAQATEARERFALRKALRDIIAANDDFRRGMSDEWEGDPLQDACEAAKELLDAKRC